MIAEWIASFGMDIAIFIAGLFPEWDIPGWVIDSRGQLVSMIEAQAGLGVWIDWGVLGLCITATVTTYSIAIVIKLVRAAAGHIPQIGGKGD